MRRPAANHACLPLTRRAFALGGAAACVAGRPATAAPAFRFGLTPVFVDDEWPLLQILKDYLEAAMERPVEFVQRRTYKEVAALLVAGELDAAWLCGYPLLQYQPMLAALALPLWRGASRYQSYVIVDAGRGASQLGALRGDIHAYSDPDSNSGYLVTVSELVARGEAPEAFFARSFFTFGHSDVVRAVARGLAQSGSVDGYVWEVLAEIEPELTARTRILWRSEWFGFPPIVAQRQRLESPEITRFATALREMRDDRDGRRALERLHLDGFDPASEAEFSGIAARMRRFAERE